MSEERDEAAWIQIDNEVMYARPSEVRAIAQARAQLRPEHLLARIKSLEEAFQALLSRLERAAERD